MYNDWVAGAAAHGCRLLKKEQRLRLARGVLGRVMAPDGTIHTADLAAAGLVNHLGDVWLLNGWRERRRVLRAHNVDLAILKVVLDGAEIGFAEATGVVTVNPASLKTAMAGIATDDELREALQKRYVDAVREHRAARLGQRAGARPTTAASTSGAATPATSGGARQPTSSKARVTAAAASSQPIGGRAHASKQPTGGGARLATTAPTQPRVSTSGRAQPTHARPSPSLPLLCKTAPPASSTDTA